MRSHNESIHQRGWPRWLARALVLLIAGSGAAVAQPPCPGPEIAQYIAADGDLAPEIEAALRPTTTAPPNILTWLARAGFTRLQVDNVFDGGYRPGSDGFRDAGLRCPNIPDTSVCGQSVQCADPGLLVGGPNVGRSAVRTALNHGKLTVILLPDTDGFIDPTDPEGTDDSILYVGMDIFNGFPYPEHPDHLIGDPAQSPPDQGLTWWTLDFDDVEDGGVCGQGVRDLVEPFDVPDFFGVPFDLDADGKTRTISRWDGLPPACVPGNGCDGLPDPPEDASSEAYRILLYHCTTGQLGVDVGQFGERTSGRCFAEIAIIATPVVLPGGVRDAQISIRSGPPGDKCPEVVAVPANWVSTFPAPGLASALDYGPNDPPRRDRDVEFIICHVNSLLNLKYPPANQDEVQYNLARFARGGVYTFSDSQGDSAAEDHIWVPWNVPQLQIEAHKGVRCLDPEPCTLLPAVGDGASADLLEMPRATAAGAPRGAEGRDAAIMLGEPAGPVGAYQPSVTAASGARVQFRIEIENTGNRPLRTTVTDAVELIGGAEFEFTPADTCFRATLVRPGVGSVEITEANAAGFGLVGAFFRPDLDDPESFLSGVRFGLPRLMGTLQPSNACVASGQGYGFTLGDRVILEFCGTVRATVECAPGQLIRVRNKVSVLGEYTCTAQDSGCLSDTVLTTRDAVDNVDTPREKGASPPADNNAATVDIKCRRISVDKKVALCMACTGCEAGNFVDDLTVPIGPFPMCITYRYTVTNHGEFSERVRVFDPFLCSDFPIPPGITFVSCDVCPNGSEEITLAPGQTSAPLYCTVKFADRNALDTFLAKDDVPPAPARECGGEQLPGQSNPRCYSNCALAVGCATNLPLDVCPSGENTRAYDTARVCGCCATIDVTKDAACLTGDMLGSYSDPLDNLVPGSRARFRVTICNTSAEGTPVSRLRITDTLAGTPAACVTLVPGSAVFRRGAQVCPTPLGFNIVGTPFEWDLATCGGDLLAGQCVEFTFDVRIADDATENCDPLNTVRVEAQPNCGPGVPPFWCGEDTDTASIDVKRVGSLTCTKEWQAEWDSDLDCQPGPATTAYSSSLSLCDLVFPIRLRLRVTAQNGGEVPLSVTPIDTILCSDCVGNTPGVTFESSEICPIPSDPPFEPITKIVPAGGAATWTVVLRVDTAAAMRALAANCDLSIDNRPDYFKNRVTLGAALTGDVCPGNPVPGGPPCEAEIRVPDCALTIDKKVKCADDPDTAYANAIEALPGAVVTYRIIICNPAGECRSKLPVIDLYDLVVDGTPDPNSVVGKIGAVDVTPCVRPLPTDGSVKRIRLAPCRPAAPWLAPGECLVITFNATMPAGDPPLSNCQTNPNAESLNRARAVGYPEACDPPSSSGCDAQPVTGADVCVTPQQDPQHYSHWVCAKVNIKVPTVECRKEVQLDFNNNGTPDTGFVAAAYANCDAFPLAITYRWTAKNVGETGLTGVRVCDLPLLTAVCNANNGQAPQNQIQFVSCALCDGACCPPSGNDGCAPLPDLPACGDEASAQCKIIVPNWEAWLRLTGNQQCLTNTSQVQARAIVPSTLCDFNANVNAAPSTCSATVCVAPPCNILVDKQLRCTTTCGGAGQGSFVDGPRDVVPGSGFEFTFKVRNLDTPPYAEQICELEITDTLTGPTDWSPATWIPCEYWPNNCESGQPIDLPQCFKADGTPYRVILPQPMQPSGCLRVKPGVFKPCIPASPVGDQVTNTVVVRGAPGIWVQGPQGQWSLQCTAGAEPFCCSSTDTVTLNIKRPAVACVKEWCAQWDSNASGAIDAGDATLPCTGNLDLCLAVFPVRLTLRVTANNTGNVDLLVTPNDQGAINCMEARGASVGACELRPPVAKTVPAGGSATWTCVIDVPNAQVMRDIAEFCDALIDNRPRVFVNRVTLTGVPTGVCPGNAIESDACEAEIRAPEPCDLTIDKRVKCLPEDDAQYRYLAQALPGARVKYRVQICNFAGACQPRVPQIELRDVFCNAGAVDATTVRADVNGVDVSACLPAPLNFTGGANYIKFGPCLPGRPWLEPGECLTVTFEATMPAGIPPVNCVSNSTPECRNRARAVGYTEALTPPPATLPKCNANPVTGAFVCLTQQQDPQNWPYWVCADVDVRVPQVACTKLVSADLDGVAGYEVGPAQQIDFDINNATFPIRIRFSIRATNTGEVPLGPLTINDLGLVAAAIAAGVAPADIVCSSGGPPWTVAQLSNCGDASADVDCVIVFQTEQILRSFLAQDGEQVPECFTNVAEVIGTPIPGSLCGTAGDVSSECAAQVCIVGGPCCPPIVKAVADIWNQNEIRMSGTERCLCAWDETLLSRWTLESGLPNHFLRQFLQTDRGRARIDGVRSVVVCGPESQAWPLLGVSMKFLKFGSDVTQAGVPLTAVGEERGLILVPGASVPRGKGAGDALTQLERMKLYDPGVPDETPGGRGVENDVPFTRRADTTEKGSFLAFVKVEIKWDSSGRLIQDTFIQLTNDGSSDVFVKIFQVNDNQVGCPAIDNTIVLTHDEPAYWAASTGQPKGVSAFTLLDPQGDPDTDPHNPGGRVLRGYIIAFAVNSVDAEIRWNHLSGAATIVNYALRSAWEYNPWSFRAWSAEEGQVLAGNPGQLEFDGVEYDWAPARLLLEFFAPGARLQSSSGKSVVVEDTDLTLWAMFRDLTEF